MRSPEAPPPAWRWLGRCVVAATIERRRREEVHQDLLDLWRHRREAGRHDLRRAWLRDLAGLVVSACRRPDATYSTFGGPSRWRGGQGGHGMWQDVRYALRLMRRRPATTIATVLTLAVGIGASVAIFTALDRLLLRPLPYPDPARLVSVEHVGIAFGTSRIASRSFADLPVVQAAGGWASGGANLEDGEGAVRVAVGVVDRGFFETLNVPPAAGEWPPAGDAVTRTAMLSHDLWRARFGADPAVIGRSITLNSQVYTVAGVMPPGFTFPGRTEVWIPPSVDYQATGAAFAPSIIARLSPDVSFDQAAQAIAADSAARARTRGQATDPDPTTITPLADALTGPVRPTLLLLAGSVALLLLVVCASVANLLLARVSSRDQEYALRRALGGTRWRIARQVLIESLLLSFGGAALGAVAAGWALDSLRLLAPAVLGDLGFGAVDPRLIGIAVLVSVGAAVVFGAAPGLAAAGSRAEQVARLGRSETGSPVWRHLRAGLIVGQMAMALVLLTASAATLGALLERARVDLGFGRTSAVAMTVTLPLARFEDPMNTVDFFERARDRLAAAPGIVRVGATGYLPGSHETGVGMAFSVPGRPEQAGDERFYASYLSATPDYFRIMGIPVVAGREFRVEDRRGAQEVAILSETAARGLFPGGGSPIGHQIQISRPGGKASQPIEVVGVVADVRLHGAEPGLSDRTLRQVYVSLLQNPPFGSLSFVAETGGTPAAAIATVREAMREVDAAIPVYDAHTIASVADGYLAPARLAASLVSGFALVTLIVSALGLYGVMAQVVARRTREIGIRLALGAPRATVERQVVTRGLALVALGLAAGLAGAGATLGVTSRLLVVPGTGTTAVLTGVAALVLAVTLVANWIPARRAARIDAMGLLRGDG
ncbi:MAG: ADOP family duplicated permease [Vicinamibacterales bacterium]